MKRADTDFIEIRETFPDAYQEYQKVVQIPERMDQAMHDIVTHGLECVFWIGFTTGFDTHKAKANEN